MQRVFLTPASSVLSSISLCISLFILSSIASSSCRLSHLVVILSFISSTSVNVRTLSRCSFRRRHLSISLFPCQIHWKGRRLQAAFISRHWSSVVLLCNESFYRPRHRCCHPSRRPSRLLSCPHLIVYRVVILLFIALCRHLVVILSFISSTSVNIRTLSRCSFRHRHLSISLFPCQIHWKGRRLQAAYKEIHFATLECVSIAHYCCFGNLGSCFMGLCSIRKGFGNASPSQVHNEGTIVVEGERMW